MREALAVSQASASGTQANDMGVAGRVAITRLRDVDMPELTKAVEELPGVYLDRGYDAALAYCRNELRRRVDALALTLPRTGDLVRARHRVHMMLSEGECDPMMRSDTVGLRARLEFLEVVERYFYSGSVQAAFAHGAETPAGIMPVVPWRGGEGRG